MKTDRQQTFTMDGLESRTMLSHGGLGAMMGGLGHWMGRGHGHNQQPPSAAVQADLDKISQDRQQLATDQQTLGPTLRDDRKAIFDAIKAMDTQLAPLRQKVRDDAQTWWTTIRADLQAIRQDRGDATKLASDRDTLKADQIAAQAAIKADADAIQAAIDADPTVQAAKQKLATDRKPIDDDQALLQADQDQLRTDLQAQNNSGGTTTGGDTGGTTTGGTTAALKVFRR